MQGLGQGRLPRSGLSPRPEARCFPTTCFLHIPPLRDRGVQPSLSGAPLRGPQLGGRQEHSWEPYVRRRRSRWEAPAGTCLGPPSPLLAPCGPRVQAGSPPPPPDTVLCLGVAQCPLPSAPSPALPLWEGTVSSSSQLCGPWCHWMQTDALQLRKHRGQRSSEACGGSSTTRTAPSAGLRGHSACRQWARWRQSPALPPP